MTFFECLFGKEKTKEEIASDIEYSNEENYRYHRRETTKDFFNFKEKNKEMIEYHLQKPIQETTLKDCIKLGFNSEHFTRKHLEEVMKNEKTNVVE